MVKNEMTATYQNWANNQPSGTSNNEPRQDILGKQNGKSYDAQQVSMPFVKNSQYKQNQ
jgi:hypothetical protein